MKKPNAPKTVIQQVVNHNWDEYRRMWKELHLRALLHKDGYNDTIWLATWAKRLKPFQKAGSCPCSEHWKKWNRTNPPKFDTKEAYFAWTVNAHNNINRLNGKKEWTVEESKQFYEQYLQDTSPISKTIQQTKEDVTKQ